MSDERIAGATEDVLSTLNRDGTRRWIRPKLSSGRFHWARFAVAWGLIGLFTAIPFFRMNGKPLMLFDLPKRQFTFFGTTFLPTDTFLLMLLLVGIFVAIFLLTAIFGRVWCGWGCPQTVYMEFVYRPLERWLEGGRAQQLKLDRDGPNLRRLLKYPVFLVVSAALAHTFLAYFVGVEQLWAWMHRSPLEHPTGFVIVALTTGLMMADFAFFREQVCILACPYGRFQSVLLDRDSLIVGYDTRRGEPRGRFKKGEERRLGDCIDCRACVVTCPTGIDIRQGLQMECIGCTQCIDACDEVMDRVSLPRGLIRYSSQNELEGARRRILRPRVVIYPLLLVAAFGALAYSLAHREAADVTLLRGLGAPFTELQDGAISNQVRIKIANRADADRAYAIELVDLPGATFIAPENPLPVAAGDHETTAVFVNLPRSSFVDGKRDIRLRITDHDGFDKTVTYRLLGPSAS